MAREASGGKRPAVQRFWHNYLSVLEQSSVPARARPYYRKAVEAYVDANRGRRLATHEPSDVDRYLAAKGRLPHLQEWQFRQIVDALRLLFCTLLRTSWAASFDWERWRVFSATLQPDHATLHDDPAPGQFAFPSRNTLIKRFQSAAGRDLANAAPYTFFAPKRRIPVVLGQDEVRHLLRAMTGQPWLMAALMYGTGMRLMECIRLRVQDVDFGSRQITVRNRKGAKDRVVPLPEKLVEALKSHLAGVRSIHREDLQAGFGEAHLPHALARKIGGAARDWRWQYVFPAPRLSVDPASAKTRRHHVHETGLQRAIRKAASAAAIDKRVTSHTLRHSFATHLLQGGKDIRVIQELLGHTDLATMTIYTHVLKKGGLGVQSPLDML